MLIDKFDSPPQELPISPKNYQIDAKLKARRLPKLQKTPYSFNQPQTSSLQNLSQAKTSRRAGLNAKDRIYCLYDDQASTRGPRVNGKNLPEVFNTNTPGARKLK